MPLHIVCNVAGVNLRPFLSFVIAPTLAFSAQLDRDFALRFYNKIRSCQPLTLPCLIDQDLVEEIRPYLYVFKGQVTRPSGAERFSALRISNVFKLPILLAPHLPGMDGVPTVDAILFSSNGTPLSNISIKSYGGRTINGGNILRRSLSSARGSYGRVYNSEYFQQRFQHIRNADLRAQFLSAV